MLWLAEVELLYMGYTWVLLIVHCGFVKMLAL